MAGVRIVDPKTGSLSSDKDVAIESGRISTVKPSEVLNQRSLGKVIDAGGKFFIPGFLDMHTHCIQDPDPRDSLSLMLSWGITGFRQMAGSSTLLQLRREGRLDFGPDTPELLAMPGDVLTSANAATPSASLAEVQKQKKEGADFIKTIFVTPRVFAASIAEANRLALPYGGHVSPGVDMAQASDAGLRFIEHLGPVEALLINCSKLEFVLMLLLRLRPPAAMRLSMEGEMGEAMRYIIANPILFRLKLDKGSLGKTQRLLDTSVEKKSRRIADTLGMEPGNALL